MSSNSDASLAFPFSAFRLDGKVALVTGASAGLGAGIVEAYAAAGAEVIALARSQDSLEALAARIQGAGGRCRAAVCDVTDTAGLRQTIAGLPRLDILVNNAGTNFPEPIDEVSEHHLDVMLDLNVRSVYIAAQCAVRKMREDPERKSKGGVIINMSSQMGHIGSPNRTVYCMTKHALEGFTKALAVELAPEGIRVNSIAPTFVDTPLVRRVVDTPEKRAFIMSRIPMARLATVEEISAAALYLASPAAGMVTGTSLVVDGGWTAQ
ncbi:MAG: SDR family oxidoreductase [Betaproteobacteria bacterium]|nr:SDR family oxidoreductase [Betaproteobacteria bacterium]